MDILVKIGIYVGVSMLMLGLVAIGFLIWMLSCHLFPKKVSEPVRHGDNAKCGHCGYTGIVSGRLAGIIVTAPWCPVCNKNDRLILIEEI